MTQPNYNKKGGVSDSGLNDRHQEFVLKKIKAYLENRGREKNFNIKGLSLGYCFGITTLWLYSKWLSFQPKPSTGHKDQRDDAIWFQNTISEILAFDEDEDKEKINRINQEIEEINKSDKDPQEKKEIIAKKEKEKDIDTFERFLAHIQLFQNPSLYFPKRSQIKLDLTLEDTKGHKLKKVYSIAGSFTSKQLQLLLTYPDIIQDDTFITIYSNNHTTGLFKHGGLVTILIQIIQLT